MWNTLVDLTLPRTCPGCGAAVAWCPACASLLQGRPRRVIPPMAESEFIDSAAPAEPGPPSAAAAHGGAMELGLPPAYALARYRGPVRAAILAAKEHGRRDLPAVLGAALGRGLVRLLHIAVHHRAGLVGAGSDPPGDGPAARRRPDDLDGPRRGALELVRCGYPAGVSPCLFTGRGARDSVGLSAADRIANLDGRIRWRSPGCAAATGAGGAPRRRADHRCDRGRRRPGAAARMHRSRPSSLLPRYRPLVSS